MALLEIIVRSELTFIKWASRWQTLHYLRTLMEKLPTGAVVCCEEALGNAGALADYLTYVHDCPGLESLLVPIGAGVEVTYKSP